MFSTLASLVLGVHVALFLLLGAGAAASAVGWWLPRAGIARLFWPIFAITVVWALAPASCPLTMLETWLRQQQVPGWERLYDLPQTVTQALFGVRLPRVVYSVLGVGLLGLGVLGFWRTWRQDEAPPRGATDV